jgi:2Fe-2S ferredoxin
MTRILFVEADGTETEVNATDGWTLMQAAVNAGVDGIEAECGGSCACATCHCFIEAPWAAQIPAASGAEDALLDSTSEPRRASSRLACQVAVSAELDGARILLPATQS